MARSAAEADHDDRFPTPLGSYRSRGSEAQQVGKGQSADAQRAHAQKIAPGKAVAKLRAATGGHDMKHGYLQSSCFLGTTDPTSHLLTSYLRWQCADAPARRKICSTRSKALSGAPTRTSGVGASSPRASGMSST